MSTPKKVLIACPTLGLDPDPTKWLSGLLTILNDIRRNNLGHACIFPYRMTWWPANNMIWDTAFEHGFDYILRLDDDVWAVGKDYFSRLLQADKDVIGAAYPIRQFPYSYCALNHLAKDQNMIQTWRSNQNHMAEVTGTGIQPVDLVGFGMTLIKVDAFKNWSRPIYPGQEVCPDDTWLAQCCKDKGIQQYVHMDLKLAHREVMPHNRLYLFNADARAALAAGEMMDNEGRFADELVRMFGADGMKDITTLKGIAGMEPSRIITA